MKRLAWSVAVSWLVGVAADARPVRAQPPAEGRTRAVNGMQMYYEERGHGPPLVLLHNYGGCTRTWQPHVERLAEHYRVLVPDLRGHGRSTNPSGEFTHRQAARDVLALLDQLGVTRFRAMGISTGAMTLLHMATQQPARVEAMALVGAASHLPEPTRAIMRRASPDSLTPGAWARYRECTTQGDAQVRQLASLFHAFNDSYDDMNFTEPYLSTITARTLIVHGDRDAFFPVAIPVAMYRAIPRASLWIVPDGGHVPIFGARARQFQDEALAFLRADAAQP
jgi:pimeloyl-ACP methyl ester carboxylesterase